MTRDAAFFYQIIKPGRYLGTEFGVPRNGHSVSAREIVWYYPDRYERAITDSAWRRSYFQVAGLPGVRVSRAVEYARDVWSTLAGSGKPVFSLDHLDDIRAAACIVFWAPDVLTAAHIPSIMRRAGLDRGNATIGVICNGTWIPRFLGGHVDWIVPAPNGWLQHDLVEYIRNGGTFPPALIHSRDSSRIEELVRSWRQSSLETSVTQTTPRWVPRVEVEEDFFDVELSRVDVDGTLTSRSVSSVVMDALDGLQSTGVDGVRFCQGGAGAPSTLVGALSELQRRFSMKRVRAWLPAITCNEFRDNWLSYKPHMLKPTIRLSITETLESVLAAETGNRALNHGWQGITGVLQFDSFETLTDMLAPTQSILRRWSVAAQGHADKRPLRLMYKPAPVARWRDSASEPDETSIRHLSSEFRQFKDELSRIAAVGTFRIEDVIARNWLATADCNIWDRLAALDLSDTNESDAPPFDWYNWFRQASGFSEPPRALYLSVPDCPDVSTVSVDDPVFATLPAAELNAPADNLFGRRRQRSGISRRIVAPPMTRMRVRWAKGMSWRLYSHLDVVRAIERSVRRAGLPASYSEGFHPRLKLSFGPPLAFGLLSETEYFDLMLEEDFQSSDTEKLERQFPEGLRLLEARGVAAGMPALSDVLNEAVYTGTIPIALASAQQKLEQFRALDQVSWVRIGRDDRRPVDPRKTLRSTSVNESSDGTRWELSVTLGGEGNIRPTEWAMLLFGFTQGQLADIIITRTELNIRKGSTVRTPFDTI